MRLTTKGRFAVTAMIDLALRSNNGPVALAAISQRQQISLSYLEQLFGKLRRHELVESTRNGVALAAVSDSQVSNEFASGRVVFAFEWTSRLREVDRFVTAGAGHKWGVAPIPSTDGAPASLLRAPLLVIPRTRDVDETQAWLFVRWMLDTAQTARWAAATDEFPARLSAITMLDPARMPKNYTVALQRIGGAARVEPLLPSWTCVVDGLNQTALLLLNTQSITDTLTAGQLQMSEHLSAPCALR